MVTAVSPGRAGTLEGQAIPCAIAQITVSVENSLRTASLLCEPDRLAIPDNAVSVVKCGCRCNNSSRHLAAIMAGARQPGSAPCRPPKVRRRERRR
jgi:hypothetical protein